jgi:hypothetical protein
LSQFSLADRKDKGSFVQHYITEYGKRVVQSLNIFSEALDI